MMDEIKRNSGTLNDGRVFVQTTFPDGSSSLAVEQKSGIVQLAFNAATMTGGGGLIPSDEAAEIKDRAINVVLQRDDNGVEQAFRLCEPLWNAMSRRRAAVNTGLIFKSLDEKEYEKPMLFLKNRFRQIELTHHLDSWLDNRVLFGVGASGKLRTDDGDIIDLVDLDTREEYFKLIVDSTTGNLGGSAGLGLEPSDREKEVVAVQQGYMVNYSSTGEKASESLKYTYFGKDDVLVLGNHVRGRIRGTAEARRVVRSIEAWLSAQNALRNITRTPSQWLYTIGNEQQNLNNCALPESYKAKIQDGTYANDAAAREAFKTAAISAFSTESKKMVEGNVMFQILEWGIEIQCVNAASGEKGDYILVCEYWEKQIKEGILTIETQTNRVVTSGVMEENIDSALIRRAQLEQQDIENLLNEQLVRPLLEVNYPECIDSDGNLLVWVEFKPIEEDDPSEEIKRELLKAQVLLTYSQAGLTPPEKLLKEWGIEVENESEEMKSRRKKVVKATEYEFG